VKERGIAPLIIAVMAVVVAVVVGVGIYVATRGGGASGNFVRSPLANFSLNPENAMAYYNIQFTDNSLDNLGTISSWSWNFGDNSTSTYQNPVHTYTEPGTYEVSLTVTDNNGMMDNCARIIEVLPWLGEDNESLDEYVIVEGYYIVGGDGHIITLHNNPYAKDPTWENLKSFLRQDNTALIQYVDNSFVCSDYSETLHNNVEKAGIRAAYVSVYFRNQSIGHACNAFRINGELYFIDVTNSIPPTNSVKLVGVDVGQEYVLVSLFSGNRFYSMGIVDSYEITW